jgi:5-methylthioadenosine/S-adenosylhomocysteine deaminase
VSTVLITGGSVLTCTTGSHGAPVALWARRTDLLVVDGRIAELPTAERTADEVIDATGMLVIPGLVQAHVHLCQTLMRGLADDCDVVEWLRTAIWPAEQAHDEHSLRASAELGIAELLTSGTTTALTMETALSTEVVLDAVDRLGIRAIVGPALMDLQEPGTQMVAQSIAQALATVTDLVKHFHGTAGGRVQVALSPRGTYNGTPELWRECVRLADEWDLRLHTHASENAAQAERLERTFGQRDAQALAEWGALGPRLTIAHGIWLDPAERALVRSRGAHICHCPTANLKLGSGIAPVPDYLAAGINVALGTDGAACNNSLDGVAEMRLAALLHKPRYGPQAMPAERVFAMATMGGAAALGLQDVVGRLEPGLAADITCLRLDGLHVSPAPVQPARRDAELDAAALASSLVYSARASDVDTVLVQGEVVVRAGQLVSADQVAISTEAAVQRARLTARLP